MPDTSWMTAAEDAPDVAGLECTGKLKLDYATGFDVYYYENDYALIDVHDSAQYLLVPDGQEAPDGLASDVIVLQKPLNRIYLAASSAMALFRALDSLDCIKMTGIDASGWYIQEAKDAIEEGAMQFAGKYSEPDYEMLVDEDCDVAIESTMILHTPKVQEMIENLGIPVFIDRSSYEMHPLGRTEWVKLYGAMMGKEAEAADFFDRQAEVIDGDGRFSEYRENGSILFCEYGWNDRRAENGRLHPEHDRAGRRPVCISGSDRGRGDELFGIPEYGRILCGCKGCGLPCIQCDDRQSDLECG